MFKTIQILKTHPYLLNGICILLGMQIIFSNCEKKKSCFAYIPATTTNSQTNQKTKSISVLPIGEQSESDCEETSMLTALVTGTSTAPAQVVFFNESGATATRAGLYNDSSCTQPAVETTNIENGTYSKYLDFVPSPNTNSVPYYYYGYVREGGASVCVTQPRSFTVGNVPCEISLRHTGGGGATIVPRSSCG
ncbi:hypothetical protein [Leptospira kanakyensis]|uniref:hypothetical protein n=1 Tax=Leptospira kanakyensis TaxID=2484968 RepID=UPI001FC8F1A0|nr:hypothetical protein [Leptospira kanakyensis]